MQLPNQKGTSQLLIILIVLAIVGSGGTFFLTRNKSDNPKGSYQLPLQKKESTQGVYQNQDLGIQISYSKELTVQGDTEEEFNKRGNGDFRKNFNSYVNYSPGKFLGAVVVLENNDNFDVNPFTVWVFDNPEDLTIDSWYGNYWFYPFVWGDFTSRGKIELAPKEEATISGQLGKSGVIDYQPGKPRFIYVSKDKKTYLFRIIGEKGDKILSSFTFQSK